jgi:excisionase family DNA binding protein
METVEIKELKNILLSIFTELKEKPIEPLLSFDEVKKILGVGKSQLYQMVGNREIPVVKIDRHIRFEKADVEEFIRRKKNEKSAGYEFNVNELKGSKYTKESGRNRSRITKDIMVS